MKPHALAELFPPLGAKDLKALADDIKANGLVNPIITYEDKVLDGRNRLAACKLAKVEPRFEEWKGEGDPTTWVVSQNVHRRHLTESQRAMLGAKLLKLEKEKAKQRMSEGGKKGGETKSHKGLVTLPTPLSAKPKGSSHKKVAELMKVSASSIQYAEKVEKKAVPALAKAVREGKVKVSAAAKLADKSKAVQKAAATKAERGEKVIAPKEKKHVAPNREWSSEEAKLRHALLDLLLYALNCKGVDKKHPAMKQAEALTRDMDDEGGVVKPAHKKFYYTEAV